MSKLISVNRTFLRKHVFKRFSLFTNFVTDDKQAG